MYVIEVKQQTEAWLVAICPQEEQATEYLNSLSPDIQVIASCYKIAIETFPLIVVENKGVTPQTISHFDFCSIEDLQIHFNTLRKQKVSDQEHVYFKYYFIDEEYYQMVSDENYMTYLQHTTVTNDVLDEVYEVTAFHEYIKKSVSTYYVDGLDQLFEHTKTVYTSRLEKEDLAFNGYDQLFWKMNYDYACGKLTEVGIQYLLPMVEHIEQLLGEKKWQHRSFALNILLEQACKEDPEKAPFILEDTIEAFNNYLLSDPEEALEIHRLLSTAHQMVMEVDHRHAFMHWVNALNEIRKATALSPEKASWSTLLQLIYVPLTDDAEWMHMQLKAKKSCKEEMIVLETIYGSNISYNLALAYQQLREYLEWKNVVHVFPEAIALSWAEKALSYNPQEITRMDLHECAEFFHRIGSSLKRIDFLLKSISLYEDLLKTSSDSALEVSYIAGIWKEIAEINLSNQEKIKADNALEEAQAIYRKKFDQVKSNPSVYLRYVEFLEYCFTYEGSINKPSLSELKKVADEVELQSKGFLSYPYTLLMHIALFQNNEKQAILELTKSLILHEYGISSTIDNLLDEFKNSDYKQLFTFLNETKLFMQEVSQNYYYDPALKWKRLRTMSAEELMVYWENRKDEIRNRISFFD